MQIYHLDSLQRKENVDLAEAVIEITKSAGFDSLPEVRRKSLEATWVQFVTSQATMEQPSGVHFYLSYWWRFLIMRQKCLLKL